MSQMVAAQARKQVQKAPASIVGVLQRKCRKKPLLKRSTAGAAQKSVPSIVHDVLRSPGQPLDKVTRNFMEPRFRDYFGSMRPCINEHSPVPTPLAIGAPNDVFEQEAETIAKNVASSTVTPSIKRYDFSGVRVHTDARAGSSAQAIGALAYTVGNDIVFDVGRYAPGVPEGRSLLAHELTHVIQQNEFIRPYRRKTAFNFGKKDDGRLIEDSFSIKKDKETKPWIKLITVEFTSKKTDADGNNYWAGTASVQYYDNPAKFANFTFAIAGGSKELGKTDKGSFTVQRIEGVGYNSGSFSGREGVDYDISEREGPRKRYSKDLRGNMSFAVFYNKGEALHAGPLDYSSHGCVHVDWADDTNIKQLNYHSVIGLTKVIVKYSSSS